MLLSHMETDMIKRVFFVGLAISICVMSMNCGGKNAAEPPGELKIVELRAGGGDVAVEGTAVTVHYTGWLYNGGKRGAKFDSSLDSGAPFTFNLGKGEVIKGWDDGIKGMRVGGKRQIIIPPELGYGKPGAPPTIPPDSTLEFEVELLKLAK
jgi:FKBP-type peptidyl-prolyl cis-trans isomerase FkpA